MRSIRFAIGLLTGLLISGIGVLVIWRRRKASYLRTVKAALDLYTPEVTSLPNVFATGITVKRGKPHLTAYVTKKVPVTQLKSDEVVPPVFFSGDTPIFITVEEIGAVKLESHQKNN